MEYGLAEPTRPSAFRGSIQGGQRVVLGLLASQKKLDFLLAWKKRWPPFSPKGQRGRRLQPVLETWFYNVEIVAEYPAMVRTCEAVIASSTRGVSPGSWAGIPSALKSHPGPAGCIIHRNECTRLQRGLNQQGTFKLSLHVVQTLVAGTGPH